MKDSVWSPLKYPIYRAFWICACISNLGTWIQDVASSWVMTHVSTSPLIVALLSFSTSLPIMFLSIWAGWLADKGHRRAILLIAQAGMFLAAFCLAYFVWFGKINEFILLGLSLLMGVGIALNGPAFQSVLSDLVPVEKQAQAVFVYYIGINLSRVVGPMVGGGILSTAGPAGAFLANSISFLGLILFFWIWPMKKQEVKEDIAQTPNQWRFLFSLHNLRLWVEIFLVTFFASSIWALYPTRGRLELHLSSWQFGSLLAYLGIGACISAFLSDRVMSPNKTHQSLAGAYLIYSLGIFVLGWGETYTAACVSMLFAGAGWIVLATLMNMSSRQLTGASPLKSTMLGVFYSVFYAGMALGAVTWGGVAKAYSTTSALSIAAAGLCFIGIFKLQHRKLSE